MPTITKAATSNAVITGIAFTNPTNAYADDGVLATLSSSAKNANPVGEHGWGFPGITTAEIPDGSTINAVRCVGEMGLTVAGTGFIMGLNGVANGTTDGGTEQTKSTAGLGILTYTYVTIPNLTDLRTAGFYESSVRYRRGNSTVSSTAQVDYLTLEIDYTAPAGTTVTPTTAALTTATFAPTVTVSNNVTVTPSPAGGASYSSTILADSPTGYWRLGEPSGTTADNAEGTAARDGTYTNSPTLAQTGALTGDSDTAVDFTGTAPARYVTVTGYTAMPSPVSVEAWINESSIFDDMAVAGWWSSGTEQCFLYLTADNVVRFGIGASTTFQYDASGLNIRTGWHHLVGTHDGTNARLYIDGALRLGPTAITWAGATSAYPFMIGNYGNVWSTTGFPGSIDEPAVYPTALSAAQVAAHYAAGTGSGGLVLSTFVPTITVEAVAGVTVTPTTASLTTSTFAPTITATDNQSVTPSTASLTTATFAPTVDATANVLVTPTTAGLTTATFAPTVTGGAGQTVTPSTASLSLAAFAPTVTASTIPMHVFQSNVFQANVFQVGGGPAIVTPGLVALALTAYAPVVTGVAPALATPTTASLTLATFAPTVTASDHVTVTPATASLTTATFAPVVSATAHQTFTPATANLSLSTMVALAAQLPLLFSPSVSTVIVSVSDHQTPSPSTATLTLETFAPTVTGGAGLTVTPSTASLTVSALAPTVTASDHQTVTPSTASLSLAAFAPTVATPVLVTPTTAGLAATAFAPNVTASDYQLVTPSTASLALSAFAPTVTGGANVTVTPDAASLVLSTFAPTVTGGAGLTVTPSTASLALTAFAPTTVLTDHVAVTPSTVALSLASFAPTVTASDHQLVTPTTAALTTATFAPTVTAPEGVWLTPTTASLILAAFAPVVTASADIVTGGPGPSAGIAIRLTPRGVAARGTPVGVAITPVPRAY